MQEEPDSLQFKAVAAVLDQLDVPELEKVRRLVDSIIHDLKIDEEIDMNDKILTVIRRALIGTKHEGWEPMWASYNNENVYLYGYEGLSLCFRPRNYMVFTHYKHVEGLEPGDRKDGRVMYQLDDDKNGFTCVHDRSPETGIQVDPLAPDMGPFPQYAELGQLLYSYMMEHFIRK